MKHRLDQMYLEGKYVATSDRQKLFHQVWDKWQNVFLHPEVEVEKKTEKKGKKINVIRYLNLKTEIINKIKL